MSELVGFCEIAKKILMDFYALDVSINLGHYLLPSNPQLNTHGRTLLQESSNEISIAMEFGSQLEQDLLRGKINIHNIAVIAEEVSHLLFLVEAGNKEAQIEHEMLEVQGEVDRFIVLSCWNHYAPVHLNITPWKNIHEMCDAMFEGERFSTDNLKLYIKAEALAFKHLKDAFSNDWDNSRVNFIQAAGQAQPKLRTLRNKFLIVKNEVA